jgi:hypothetical protein
MRVENFTSEPLYSQERFYVPIQGWVGTEADLDIFGKRENLLFLSEQTYFSLSDDLFLFTQVQQINFC